MRRGNHASAIEHAKRAVAIADSGASPAREGAYAHISYANVLNRAGRPKDALAEVDGAIATLEGLGADELRLTGARATRAEALLGVGRVDEAQALAARALAEREQRMPGDLCGLATTHVVIARVADAQHRSADAARERDTARKLATSMATPDPYLLREIERR